MVQEGSTLLSFVLIWTIVIFIDHIECGPMVSDNLAQTHTELETGVSLYFTVHQVTYISRRKRDEVDHVVFPKMMVFDLEFNDRRINLRLKKHDYMTGDIHILTSAGPVQHDMGRKTGVYQDGANGASFVVQCGDYNEHCTLQGSMMIDNEMWVITPEKDTQQLHKAVQRQNGDKTKNEFGSVPLPFDIRQDFSEDMSSKYISDISPRKKRSVPTNCKIVECYAIVDETVWDLYFNLSGRVTATAEQDIAAYYLALYTQADKHFEDAGTIRNGFCLRLYFRGVSIQKTKAESWSDQAEVTIPGATPLIAFVESIAGLNECGADGDAIRTGQSLSVNTFQCFTRKDLVWNEGSRTPNYLAFYRSLAYRFMICESTFPIYQSAVVESNGDDVEVLVAKVIAQACGSTYDSETTNCADTDYYINARETLIAKDTLKQRNVWYFSTCTLESIEAYLNSSDPTCMDGSTISHAEYDTFVNQPFAGRLYSWDEQCVNRFGNNSRKCDPTGQNRTFFDDMCSAGIYCTNTEFGNGSCVGVTRPFEGTPCGTFGSYCLQSECLILHGLGENCTCHDRCNANFSFCDTTQSFTCRCQSDYYDDDGTGNIGGNCVPKVTVGQPCPQQDACLDPNAVCTNSNCTCIQGYYEENGACFRLLCFGDACNNTYQCQGDNVECSGSPSTCRCPSDRYFNVSTGNCDERKDLGTTCAEGQCLVNNSVCGAVSGVCECQEDFYDTNVNDPAGQCEPKLSLGTICPVRESCEDPNAECMATCMCKSDFFNNNGVCERKKCIGESCFNVTDCSNTGAECSGSPSTCRCPDGTFLNETTASCDTNKDLGMVCEPGQCGPANSVCSSTSGVCECQEGFYDSNGAATTVGTCEAKLSLGTACTRPDSCADQNAECSTICQCIADFYNNGGTCERQRSIGETCVNVTACLTMGAECSGTPLLCQCPDGTFLNDTTNTCDSKKDLGQSCEPGQCAPMDSKCDSTSNVCECQEGFFDTDGSSTPGGICSAKLSLGTACTRPDSCVDPNAKCSTTCQCIADFYNNRGTCERQRSIGETCVNDTACLTTGAECSGTPLLCQCPDGTFLNDTTNICDSKKDLGQSCEPGQCAPMDSKCDSTSNVCECQEEFFDTDGSYTPGGICSAKLSLGTACTRSDSCVDPNAECSTTCQCIADFYNNGGLCERQRSIGETCVNDTACLTTGAECSGTPLLCQCPDGTFLNDTTNTCDSKKHLGQFCEPGQCAPMDAKCDSTSNICECQEGFFDTDGSSTPGGICSAKLSLGTACTRPDSCVDPNAECSTTCKCIADFYNNGGTCERQRCIGESCLNVTACLTTGAECSGTPLLCQCPDGTFLNDTTNTCDNKKDLGQSCEPGQCAPMDSKCDSTSNVCECQDEFFDTDGPSTPGGNCSAKLSLDTACTRSDSCVDPNAECSTTCQCIADFYNNGGTCERQRSIGETCVNITACLTTGAECSGTPLLCQCPDRTFWNDTTNTCDSKKDLGRSCEPGQCAPMDSKCDSTSNICECQEGFFDTDGPSMPGGNCSAKLSLGTACSQPDSCVDPNAECSTTCQCIADFYNNGGTCERQRGIGETCVNVTACLTTGVECSGTPLLCQCPDGTFLNDTTNTCDSKKDLGRSCEPGQCAPMDSKCDSTSNICECQEGFFDTDGPSTPGGNCSAELSLGTACSQPDSCVDPNAECSTTCQCIADFYNNGGTCERQRGIGETCVNVTACLTTGVECSGTPLLCQCPDGTFLNDTTNTCDSRKDLGRSCESGQCAPMDSKCDSTSNICECQEGFFDTDGPSTPGGNCSAKLSLGTACTRPDSCVDPNAECSTTCQCIADFYNNGGTCERQRGIGESCVNVTACLTTGVECSGTPLLCQCPDGTFLNDTTNTCDSKKDLGQSCEPGQCAPMDSKCDSNSNVCECQERFFDTDGPSTPGGNCSARLSLGTTCKQPDSCADPNADCSTTCKCIANFYNNGGTCERQRSIGETCVNVSACLTTGAECSGTPLLCQCPDGTFLNDTTNTCDSKKDLGSLCEDGQCAPANSVCDSTSNVCECQQGFFDTDGSGTAGGNCSAKLSLGTACTQSGSCADPNAECSTTCQCIADFYNNGGTCERQRSIGETCVNVSACLTTGAECDGTTLLCQCPDGTYLNDTTNTCDSKKDLGSSCEDGQCAPANSVCDSTSNLCECQEGFFDTDGSGTTGGNCSVKLGLGTSCTFAGSCSDPNSICSVTCQCKTGFYNNGGTCSRQSGIGETCANVTGCLTPGAECSGSPLTCRCPDSAYLNDTDGTCDTKKGINESCKTGQCADPNAVCQPLSRLCTCGDGYIFNNTDCVLGCPDGFERFNSSCYFFGDQESLYSAARTTCFGFSTNALSSSLVQVDTTEELDYLKNFMSTRATQPTNGYWNDLFETTTNGNETWRTSGDALVNWNGNQPDDRNEIQLCTIFFKSTNYRQVDIECLDPVTNVGRDSRTAFPLCEIKLDL